MSIIEAQREQMLKEKDEVPCATKSICKLKQKPSEYKTKQMIVFVRIPRVLPFSIRCQVELKMALSSEKERCLGGLKENPCTYNYRVTRTDEYQNAFFFTLEQYDTYALSLEQIKQLIKCINDPYSEQALALISDRFKIISDYKRQKLYTDEDLAAMEKEIQDYPYQCTLQNVTDVHSNLSQRILNHKFLDFMGISKEVMFDHLKCSNALPTVFDHDCSLKNWCELARHSVDGVQTFEFQLNTYEGQRFNCQVEQRQLFKKSSSNPDQILFIEYRILKLDDRLKDILYNRERIYKNHLDYFNLKNTEVEFNRFKYRTGYSDAKQYFKDQRCGTKHR